MRRLASLVSPVPTLFTVGLAFFMSSCAFHTVDIYRPLIVDEFPRGEMVDAVRVAYFPEADSEKFRQSLKLTRAAWDYFDIQKYGSFYAELDIERLVTAIDLYPENAFAWTQLGAYLMLQHRAGAAIAATERSSELVRAHEGWQEALLLAELETINGINLAIYHNSAASPTGALVALAGIDPPAETDPFRRLAYYWAHAQASSAAGDVSASLEALSKACEAAGNMALREYKVKLDYSQYFKPARRAALFEYLAANAALETGDLDEALARLDLAIEGRADGEVTIERVCESQRGSRSKLWEARYLRALVRREKGDLVGALNEFELLLEQVPHKLFRHEALYYQLALTLIDRDEFVDAELALGEAVDRTDRKNTQLARAVGGIPSEGEVRSVLEIALQDEGWLFGPGYLSLGEAWLRRLSKNRGSDPVAAKEARNAFDIARGERGLVAPRRIEPPLPGTGKPSDRRAAAVGLARLEWEKGNYAQFLDGMRSALRENPDYGDGLASLLWHGSRIPESEAARESYALLLERLSFASAPFGGSETLGRRLATSFPETPEAAGSTEFAELEARILLMQRKLEEVESKLLKASTRDRSALWPTTFEALLGLQRREAEAPLIDRLTTALAASEVHADARQRRDALLVRGELRLLAGDLNGAREDFATLTETEKNWPLAERGLALAEQRAEKRPGG